MAKQKMETREDAGPATRLMVFIQEQQRHWKRLKKGVVPDKNIIEGWIESCDFALNDLMIICEKSLKGSTDV